MHRKYQVLSQILFIQAQKSIIKQIPTQETPVPATVCSGVSFTFCFSHVEVSHFNVLTFVCKHDILAESSKNSALYI